MGVSAVSVRCPLQRQGQVLGCEFAKPLIMRIEMVGEDETLLSRHGGFGFVPANLLARLEDAFAPIG